MIDFASPTGGFDTEGFSRPVSRVEERTGDFARATKRLFTARVSQNTMGDSFLASDPAHLSARDHYLKTKFISLGGNHLYSGVDGREPSAYEIRSLTLVGPQAVPIDEAARVVGINALLVYRFRAEAYRHSGDGGGDASWISGLPPGLEGFTMIRQKWDWSVREGSVGQ